MALAQQGFLGLDDRELVEAASGGDKDAFAELFRRHQHHATRIALRVTGNRHDADDAVSDAWTRVYGHVRSGLLKDRDAFGAFVRTAARNSAIDVVRRRRPRRLASVVESAPDDVTTPLERSIAEVDAALILAAFKNLTPRWRYVLWELEVQQRSISDLAQELNLTPNGVSQLAFRARAGLRSEFARLDCNARGPDLRLDPKPKRSRVSKVAAAAGVAAALAVSSPIGLAGRGSVPGTASPAPVVVSPPDHVAVAPAPPASAPESIAAAIPDLFGHPVRQTTAPRSAGRASSPEPGAGGEPAAPDNIAYAPPHPPPSPQPPSQADVRLPLGPTAGEVELHAGLGDGSCIGVAAHRGAAGDVSVGASCATEAEQPTR